MGSVNSVMQARGDLMCELDWLQVSANSTSAWGSGYVSEVVTMC